MVNSKELQVQMIRQEKSVDDLCAALGINRSTWFRKIGGESEFTQGEISRLRFELNLDDEQTGIIFFSEDVP